MDKWIDDAAVECERLIREWSGDYGGAYAETVAAIIQRHYEGEDRAVTDQERIARLEAVDWPEGSDVRWLLGEYRRLLDAMADGRVKEIGQAADNARDAARWRFSREFYWEELGHESADAWDAAIDAAIAREQVTTD